MRNRFVLLATFAALFIVMSGCGPADDATSSQSSSGRESEPLGSHSSSHKSEKAAEEPPQSTFGSIAEAMEVFTRAVDDRSNEQIIAAAQWLVDRGEASVGPLTEVMNDKQRSLYCRVAASRTLGEIGAPARSVLLAALSSDAKHVRLKSIEKLGKIKPTDQQTVSTLIGLLDSEDDRVRGIAIHALGDIGPSAKEAGPRLIAILNGSDSDYIRREADRAIKAVAPRRDFTDLEK